MAIIVDGYKDSNASGGGFTRRGVAHFSTTDTSGTITVGNARRVRYFNAGWIPSSTPISDYAPQLVGTATTGQAGAPPYVVANPTVTIVRAGSGSGLSFWFEIVFE